MKTSLKSGCFKSSLKKSKVYKFNNIKFLYRTGDPGGIGFIVKKTQGSAVLRNRFKRRCRAEFYSLGKSSSAQFSLIVSPLKNVEETNQQVGSAFNNLKKELLGA